MPRYRAKIHLYLAAPSRGTVDTFCGRRVPLHHLAVVTDEDAITCERCKAKATETRAAARRRERALRRKLGKRIA